MERLLLLLLAVLPAFGTAQDYVQEPVVATWQGPRRTVGIDLVAAAHGVAAVSGEVFLIPELSVRATGGVWTGRWGAPRWVPGEIAEGGSGSVGVRCYPSSEQAQWGRAFVGVELSRERYAVRGIGEAASWTRTDAVIALGVSRTWFDHLTVQAHVASGPSWIRAARQAPDAPAASEGPGRMAGLQLGWSW